MSESGGPTTQDGIFYQNSVAALALLQLLELNPQPPRDRVVEVRLEAPEDVDDIVIRYADDHKQYQNVKTTVTPGTAAWSRLWESLYAQFSHREFRSEDELVLVCRDLDSANQAIREACQRAATSVGDSEWRNRLTQAHKKLLSSLPEQIRGREFELFRRIQVRLLAPEQIESEFDRKRAAGATFASSLLPTLRDIAGGDARKRALLHAPILRRRLQNEFGVIITEPTEWGLSNYRSTIRRLAQLEIPGSSISGSVNSLFVWPRASKYDRNQRADFEDENSSAKILPSNHIVDLRVFPSNQMQRAVIIAGPGFGKSALLLAISSQLAESPYVPVLIPLASLAASGLGFLDYLASDLNRELDIRPDWRRLAEQGLVTLLLDGLDEIPAAQRTKLLDRLRTFSARYPEVPWLLTARDAAVLPGFSNAQEIELLPLESQDIEKFVRTMRPTLTDFEIAAFMRWFDAHADLGRLARIPLFLTMLLAKRDLTSPFPSTRSDLIESYLKTLFAPEEHKPAAASVAVDGEYLRAVAENLAFESLERQEIGASEQEVRKAISNFAGHHDKTELLFERLISSGILKRQSNIRLQFPFPIVQEYLAACYLLREMPETIADHIDDAVRRPWAQVMQFAIERHPSPDGIIRRMLDRDDDAFSTSLRLIGRCIANGAVVDRSTREEVKRRLTACWSGAPTAARKRIGSLIVDGFSRPLTPDLSEAVHKSWLLEDGAGEIISQAANRELTLSVLQALLNGELDHFSVYQSLKPALSRVGDAAFNAIFQRAREIKLADGHLSALEGLLMHFLPGSVSRTLALRWAKEQELPQVLRILAYHVAGTPIQQDVWNLVEEGIYSADTKELWLSYDILALHSDRSKFLMRFLCDEKLPFDKKRELASAVARIFPHAEDRLHFLAGVSSDATIDPELRAIFQLFSARYGNAAAFEWLVERIPTDSLEIATCAVSLFGHCTNRELAARAADLARIRVRDGAQAVRFAGAAVTGMLYLFEMDWLSTGILQDAPSHPAIDAWADLVVDWSRTLPLSEIQLISLLTAACQLGSEHARERLISHLLALPDPDSPVFDEDEYGHTLSHAFSELRLYRPLIPLETAQRLVRAERPNLPWQGIGMIAAHGNREALELLLKLHEESPEWFKRDSIANAVEALSLKLNIPIGRDRDRFVLKAPAYATD